MPVRTLRGKKCLVTGAASGIGRATALLCASQGAELVLTDYDALRLDAVVSEIRGQGGAVLEARAFDISSVESVRKFASEVQAKHGSLDVLMNIAGISTWGSVQNLSHDDWRRIVDVNLMGPIHVIECFVPEMIRARRGGHIVNVSSAAGLFGLPWHAAYSASKFGLRGVSEVLRFDLERYRIGVSLVCPGAVNTGLVATLQVRGVDTQHPQLQRSRKLFAKHAVTPEKAAQAIVRGVEKNRYLVFTSFDIRVGHWFQQKLPFLYELAMRFMNARFHVFMRALKLPDATAAADPTDARSGQDELGAAR